VNWPQCIPVAAAVVGKDNIDDNIRPMMISEDLGAFLKVVPGAFVSIGNGAADSPGGVPLHNGTYDFNESVLPIGARYFAELVRQRLPAREASK
jgi:hippurate hydrolase